MLLETHAVRAVKDICRCCALECLARARLAVQRWRRPVQKALSKGDMLPSAENSKRGGERGQLGHLIILMLRPLAMKTCKANSRPEVDLFVCKSWLSSD
jgi:hypothetical protein